MFRHPVDGGPNDPPEGRMLARQTLADCGLVRQHQPVRFPHMLVRYRRVSSADERQSVDLQRVALFSAGVHDRHLHQDKMSSARDYRPELRACLANLRALPEGVGFVAAEDVRRVRRSHNPAIEKPNNISNHASGSGTSENNSILSMEVDI